ALAKPNANTTQELRPVDLDALELTPTPTPGSGAQPIAARTWQAPGTPREIQAEDLEPAEPTPAVTFGSGPQPKASNASLSTLAALVSTTRRDTNGRPTSTPGPAGPPERPASVRFARERAGQVDRAVADVTRDAADADARGTGTAGQHVRPVSPRERMHTRTSSALRGAAALLERASAALRELRESRLSWGPEARKPAAAPPPLPLPARAQSHPSAPMLPSAAGAPRASAATGRTEPLPTRDATAQSTTHPDRRGASVITPGATLPRNPSAAVSGDAVHPPAPVAKASNASLSTLAALVSTTRRDTNGRPTSTPGVLPVAPVPRENISAEGHALLDPRRLSATATSGSPSAFEQTASVSSDAMGARPPTPGALSETPSAHARPAADSGALVVARQRDPVATVGHELGADDRGGLADWGAVTPVTVAAAPSLADERAAADSDRGADVEGATSTRFAGAGYALRQLAANSGYDRPSQRMLPFADIGAAARESSASAATGGWTAREYPAPVRRVARPRPRQPTGTLSHDRLNPHRGRRWGRRQLGLAAGAVGLVLLGILGQRWLNRVPTRELSIETEPRDAQVFVDGQPLAAATSPYRHDGVTLGGHELRVEKAGFVALAQRIPVDPGQAPALLAVTLAPQVSEATLAIASNPFGARIFLDGRELDARTPTRVPGLPLGPHKVALQLAGYADAEQTVRVPEDAAVSITLLRTAAPAVAPLLVSTSRPSVREDRSSAPALDKQRRSELRRARIIARYRMRKGLPPDPAVVAVLEAAGESLETAARTYPPITLPPTPIPTER
ncbi:MAG: PEGA domain-containing protein, partial [Polyangiales bacterium]